MRDSIGAAEMPLAIATDSRACAGQSGTAARVSVRGWRDIPRTPAALASVRHHDSVHYRRELAGSIVHRRADISAELRSCRYRGRPLSLRTVVTLRLASTGYVGRLPSPPTPRHGPDSGPAVRAPIICVSGSRIFMTTQWQGIAGAPPFRVLADYLYFRLSGRKGSTWCELRRTLPLSRTLRRIIGMSERYLTCAEVAALFGIPTEHIRRKAIRNQIPHTRFGRRHIRFSQEDLVEIARMHHVDPRLEAEPAPRRPRRRRSTSVSIQPPQRSATGRQAESRRERRTRSEMQADLAGRTVASRASAFQEPSRGSGAAREVDGGDGRSAR